MKENKITDTIKMIAGEDEKNVEVGKPSHNIVFDSSTPPVRSIVRVVLVTLLILFVAGFLTNMLLRADSSIFFDCPGDFLCIFDNTFGRTHPPTF